MQVPLIGAGGSKVREGRWIGSWRDLLTPADCLVIQIFPKNWASPHRSRESEMVKISCLRLGSPGDEVFDPKIEILSLCS